MLWLVLCDGVPGGRSGAAYGARVRAERQRPVDLAVLCALLRFLRIDRASPAAGRAVACSFASALISRMGLPWHHSCVVRRPCRRSQGYRSCGGSNKDAPRVASGGAVLSWGASRGTG